MRTLIIATVLVLAVLIAFAARAAKAPAAPIDLNRATAAELMQLPGVGRTRAEAIIAFRTAHPFRRTTDLLRVKGLGRRFFGRLRQFVTVESPSPPTASPPSVGAAAQPASTVAAQQAKRAAEQESRPPVKAGSEVAKGPASAAAP
jgi:competence ComEA-like helix-hairpin-helix protein